MSRLSSLNRVQPHVSLEGVSLVGHLVLHGPSPLLGAQVHLQGLLDDEALLQITREELSNILIKTPEN